MRQSLFGAGEKDVGLEVGGGTTGRHASLEADNAIFYSTLKGYCHEMKISFGSTKKQISTTFCMSVCIYDTVFGWLFYGENLN